ncbi:MAG: transcriptional regulator [Mesorhizobium sp.]|nr:transcriptional regulator [Mesorhizobium sp.]
MTTHKTIDAATARAQYAALAGHYRAIGPAAILAALVCMPKKGVKGAGPAKA